MAVSRFICDVGGVEGNVLHTELLSRAIGEEDATVCHLQLVSEVSLLKCDTIGVMASMIALWAGAPRIDTWSGTCNGNNYFNGLRHICAILWTMLALSTVLFAA